MELSDYLALAWLLVCWCAYTIIADHTRVHHRSVTWFMQGYRREWMKAMVLRDQRMMDATIQGNLLSGVAFFATTSLLAVGGCLAMLGSTDAALGVLAQLPWVSPSNPTQWEVKALTLVVIFIYAFFKFAWAFRLYNYGSVMIGAAPAKDSLDREAEAYAERATRINVLAARHFNRGIRAYFFALATLGWLVSAYVFMGAVALVILVLTGREFATRRLLEADTGD